MEPAGRAPERESLLPLALAAAALFPLLAALRSLDDNSLTSWSWALAGRDLAGLWALHLAAVAAAWLLSGLTVPRRLTVPALAAAAFLAGIGLSGTPEGIVDASRYFVQAKHLELHGPGPFLRQWGEGIPAWTDLPLVPFLYGLVFRHLGEHRLAAQALTAGLFALTAIATARIGRLLWGDGTGGRAGLLLLAAPCVLVNVPLLMADVPTMCAVTLALWAFLALLDRGSLPRAAAAAAALGAALLAKFSTWPLLAGALGLILGGEALRGRWGAVGSGAAAAGLGALAPLAFLLAKPELVRRQLDLLAGFQWEGLRRWVESYHSTFLFQAHPLLIALAAVALWRGARSRDARVLAVAAVPIVLFALQARRSRYLLPAFPMLALLAACGLETLGGPRRRRFAVLAAVGFSLVTVFALYRPFLAGINTANLLAAGRFLDARGVRVAEVATLPTRDLPMNPEVALPLLDYHTRARLLLRGPAPARPGAEELRTSSLRFSWEGDPAPWYRDGTGAAGAAARVLISGDAETGWRAEVAGRAAERPPDGAFTADAVFRFRTLVYVWLPED